MSFLNSAAKEKEISKQIAENFVLLVSPFAPHLGEELWQKLGHQDTLAYHPWPNYKEELTKEDKVTIAVQVNGKLRATIEASADCDKDSLEALAKENTKVQSYLENKALIKSIIIPNRLVNFVVKDN